MQRHRTTMQTISVGQRESPEGKKRSVSAKHTPSGQLPVWAQVLEAVIVGIPLLILAAVILFLFSPPYACFGEPRF